MGRRGIVLVPADRILFPSEVGERCGGESFYREPHRGCGISAGDVLRRLVFRLAAVCRSHTDCAQRTLRRRRSNHHGCDLAAFCGSLREVGADSAVCVVARCHGGADAGFRFDPCGDHGDGWGLHGGAVECAVRAGATSMKTVAIVGALTAIFAASIGLVQNDIKRVLAYSTVSQLGYMFLALGVGAFTAGVFHVFTHAFFKALLFLGSGSVIHAMSGEQDMRNMGDLRKRIPVTFATMFIGMLAIAGIPGLAGFFSKDEILWQAWASEAFAYHILWFIGFFTALMTAFYMGRLIYLTFYGQPRMSHEVEHHVHESPKSMTAPLVILAVCAVCAGWLGVPASLGGTNAFGKFLEPVFARNDAAVATASVAPTEPQ